MGIRYGTDPRYDSGRECSIDEIYRKLEKKALEEEDLDSCILAELDSNPGQPLNFDQRR